VLNWESIVHTHGAMALETAWRLLGHAADAEDVVQETFLEAFRLHGRQSIHNWGGLLRHLATRRAIDRLRRRFLASSLDAVASQLVSPSSDQPDLIAVERELAERLRWAIAKLSDREASVFSLSYLGEMGNTEIAEVLGIGTKAVGVALHKARNRLKELLRLEHVPARKSKS
jgi:RNA polymerase sigma-70 factor, ECF subfamily